MKSKVREFLSCFALLPFLALLTVTFPIWVPIVLIRQWMTERLHLYRMGMQGRFASWLTVLEMSQHGSRGSLIFEQAQKMPLRVWWTPDESIAADGPEPGPSEDDIDYLRFEVPPFMKWLHEHYTGESGRAILTDYRPSHRGGFAASSDFAPTGFLRIIPAVRLS